MVKQHNQVLQASLGLCDLAVIGGAWWGAYFIRFTYFAPVNNEIPATSLIWTNMVVTMLVSLMVMIGMGLYRPRRDKSFLLELGQVLKASALTWLILIVMLYYNPVSQSPFTRLMLAFFL